MLHKRRGTDVAVLIYGTGSDDTENKIIEGPIRLLPMPDRDGGGMRIYAQVDPMGQGGDAAMMFGLAEIVEEIKQTHAFDQAVPSALKMEDDQRNNRLPEQEQRVLSPVDAVKIVKDIHANGTQYAAAFRELADFMDTEMAQIETWIAQEEKDRKLPLPHFMQLNEEDDVQ